MSPAYPAWFVPAAFVVVTTELVLALLALRLSHTITCLLFGLVGVQILAAVYIVTAPAYSPGGGELGGANIGPAVVFGIAAVGSVIIWITCIAVALFLTMEEFMAKKSTKTEDEV